MYLDYFVNTTSPMYNFDVDSEHEDHSEELLLFVGCIVNFIVSYLICMFQDSVPAGSYNGVCHIFALACPHVLVFVHVLVLTRCVCVCVV